MDHVISDIAQLEAIYGAPTSRACLKEIDHLNEDYLAFVKASSFVILASGKRVERASLPSVGQMHQRLSGGAFDGASYDRELPELLRAGLY